MSLPEPPIVPSKPLLDPPPDNSPIYTSLIKHPVREGAQNQECTYENFKTYRFYSKSRQEGAVTRLPQSPPLLYYHTEVGKKPAETYGDEALYNVHPISPPHITTVQHTADNVEACNDMIPLNLPQQPAPPPPTDPPPPIQEQPLLPFLLPKHESKQLDLAPACTPLHLPEYEYVEDVCDINADEDLDAGVDLAKSQDIQQLPPLPKFPPLPPSLPTVSANQESKQLEIHVVTARVPSPQLPTGEYHKDMQPHSQVFHRKRGEGRPATHCMCICMRQYFQESSAKMSVK